MKEMLYTDVCDLIQVRFVIQVNVPYINVRIYCDIDFRLYCTLLQFLAVFVIHRTS